MPGLRGCVPDVRTEKADVPDRPQLLDIPVREVRLFDIVDEGMIVIAVQGGTSSPRFMVVTCPAGRIEDYTSHVATGFGDPEEIVRVIRRPIPSGWRSTLDWLAVTDSASAYWMIFPEDR